LAIFLLRILADWGGFLAGFGGLERILADWGGFLADWGGFLVVVLFNEI
jgi:hypothetical protein